MQYEQQFISQMYVYSIHVFSYARNEIISYFIRVFFSHTYIFLACVASGISRAIAFVL